MPRSQKKDYGDDINMSQYAPDQRSEREYRGNDDRYYEDERTYYKGPDAATVVPRGREAVNNMRGQQMTVRNDVARISIKF